MGEGEAGGYRFQGQWEERSELNKKRGKGRRDQIGAGKGGIKDSRGKRGRGSGEMNRGKRWDQD